MIIPFAPRSFIAVEIVGVASELKRGMHGSEVKWMAERMNNEGLKVTGQWELSTRSPGHVRLALCDN